MSTWYSLSVQCGKLSKTKRKKAKTLLRKFGFKILEPTLDTKGDYDFDISMILPLKQKITRDEQEIKELDCDCCVSFDERGMSFGRGAYLSEGVFGHIKSLMILGKLEEWIVQAFSVGTIVYTSVECDLCSTGIVTKDKIVWAETNSSPDDEPDKNRLN